MIRPLRRLPALSALATGAALVAPIAGAQASDATLRATVNSYNSRILKDEAAVVKGLTAYRSHRPAPLITALRHEVGDLRSLKAKVTKQSGSTAKGTQAKGEITKGLGLIASAYAALATDVQKSSSPRPVPKYKVMATVSTDQKGRADLRAGLKLLG